MISLAFNQVSFTPVAQSDGQIWITSSQLASALEYKQSRAVTKIFNQNEEEFTEKMTAIYEVPNLGTSGENNNLQRKTRIFSLRGCHLIAMFSKTAIAKDFRRWVLDILDAEVSNSNADQLSTVETRVPLKDAVNMMVAKTNQKYSDCWRMVHQYMNISTVEELTNQQIPEAVEYVHRICLSWESSVDREDDLFAVALMVKGEIAHMQQRSILDHVQTLIGEAHIALGKMGKYNGSVFDGLNESRVLLNIDKETKALGREKGERDFRERYAVVR